MTRQGLYIHMNAETLRYKTENGISDRKHVPEISFDLTTIFLLFFFFYYFCLRKQHRYFYFEKKKQKQKPPKQSHFCFVWLRQRKSKENHFLNIHIYRQVASPLHKTSNKYVRSLSLSKAQTKTRNTRRKGHINGGIYIHIYVINTIISVCIVGKCI